MNVVDILISIVVVTILVTIILAIVTYVAYKLRLSREPMRPEDDPSALRYFVRFDPPAEGRPSQAGAAPSQAGAAPSRVGATPSQESPLDRLDRDAADLEGHAT